MKIKKGDTVKVIAGKDRGKTGKVIRALPKVDMVIVEGVNIRKKHQRPRRSNEKGQIVDKTLPLHVSNVTILDPKSGGPTRISISREKGKRVRITRKSKVIIA